MANESQLTREGYEKLKAELVELQGPVRARIADAIREAKSHGDLKENAAYHEAKLNQTRLEHQIGDLERVLRSAKIIERSASADGSAQLGAVVTLIDLEFDDQFTITLVGAFESDPSQDLISVSSPLGEAVVGSLAGKEIEVAAPAGTNRYRIVEVKYPD